MIENRFFVSFLAMIVVGLSVFYLIRFGIYPIAIVNSHIVSAKAFEEVARSANQYYTQSVKLYASSHPGGSVPEELPASEVRRAALDKLVEDILVYYGLKNKIGDDKELGVLIENKISNLDLGVKDFDRAVGTLYGLTVERFKDIILAPKAMQEILEGRFFAEKRDFTEWLAEERKKASVIVLDPNLEWDGEKVATK